MATVLLYNFTDRERSMKIKFQLYRLGIAVKDVASSDFGLPIGALLKLQGYEGAAASVGEDFSGEMLIMHGLSQPQFSGLLDGLRKSGVSVALKAVVTETNASWDSRRLYRELNAEHAVMGQMQKSIHQSKRRGHK